MIIINKPKNMYTCQETTTMWPREKNKNEIKLSTKKEKYNYIETYEEPS